MMNKKIGSYFPRRFVKGVFRLTVFSLAIGILGCGFQLNRNRIQLPDQAKSISISKIENKSYIPRLDIKLKAFLIEKFNANAIDVKLVDQADLVLSFVISTFKVNRAEYALDETGQTYEFQFAANGNLTVFDNRTQIFYLNSVALNSTHSIITAATDLSTIEIEEGREELLDSLSQSIVEKLTDSF